MDQSFHLRHIRCREAFQCGEAFKEGGGDHVHPFVGALGREPDGDHQFVVLLTVEGTEGLWIVFFQRFYDLNGLFFQIHGKCPLAKKNGVR